MTAKESKIVAGSQIHGAQITKLDLHQDARGSFMEVYKDRWQLCIKPVQWSVVHSEGGVLRGMHVHRRHDEYIMVVSGRASVGLRDMRPGSPTEGVWSLIELTGEDPASLSFPRLVLHGWYFHEATIHLQAVSEEYESYGDDDNHGCRWDDPGLQIPWPQKDAILSPRAESFSSLRSLVDAITSKHLAESPSKHARPA